jgi:protoheme IX farnesyltransferase
MLTTAFGYITATNIYDYKLISVLIGTLSLACGSAIINHFQERNIDIRMERTRHRPIPSGKVSPEFALGLGLMFILFGGLILYFFVNTLTFLLGLLNVFWYNLIYTLLKRKTSLAIIPGSIVGTIPPVMGWVAAGEYIFDFKIISIAFFFFIWQIPHFWLLMLKFDKDYKLANLPTITNLFSKEQLARIIFFWTIATGLSSIIIPISLNITNSVTFISLSTLIFLIIFSSLKLLKFSENNFSAILAFRNINLFVFSVILILSINKLIL